MKNEQIPDNNAEQVAGFVKKAGKAANTYQLANTFIMLLILLVFAGGFAYIGVPWYICVGVVVIALLFFILGIIRYFRISAAVSDIAFCDVIYFEFRCTIYCWYALKLVTIYCTSDYY